METRRDENEEYDTLYINHWLYPPQYFQVLQYGVIHVARTHKGGGERSNQMRTILYKGEGGLILVIFVRTNYMVTPIIASKNRIFGRLKK